MKLRHKPTGEEQHDAEILAAFQYARALHKRASSVLLIAIEREKEASEALDAARLRLRRVADGARR